MNILLVESHFRSRSWCEALMDLGNLFIISVIKEEKEIFLENGISERDILDLHNPVLEQIDYQLAKTRLKKYEDELGFSTNKIVMMDRTLRLYDNEYITKYVYHILEEVNRFIKQNEISVVFIEPTWTHEILICKLCEGENIPVLAPVKCKLLADRFFIFDGYMHDGHFLRSSPADGDSLASQIIQTLQGSGEKPQYFSKFNAKNKFRFAKFKVLNDITRLALTGKKNKNIQPPWIKAVTKKLAAILRSPILRRIAPFVKQNDIVQPYVLVTLHVQPEASIDVVGADYANQLEFIRQIVRTTPIDHVVVVKEHPHAFGDRKLSFYKELASMPRVFILDPFEESRLAVKQAALVISNTGTSSLEAAIMGVPGVTAVEMYFKDLMVSPSFNPCVERVDELIEKAKVWQKNTTEEDMKRILSDIQKDSFDGNSGDFKTDPRVMSDANIQKLRDAFNEALHSV